MRLIFSFSNIIALCLCVFYLFPSCKTSSNLPGSSYKENKRRFIKIIDTSANGVLRMIDEKGDSAETYEVYPGQIVKWKIRNKAVKFFDSMPPKQSNLYSIFRKEPHKEFLSRTWKAKIAETELTSPEDYHYSIQWTDKADSPHTFDPLIQVRPKTRN